MADIVVDMYLADTRASGAEIARFLAVLSPEERRRASRFRFGKHYRAYILRRGKLRELLARYIGCKSADVPIRVSALGKPFVADSELRFNLSHSRGSVLFVVALGLDVGCDLECLDPAIPAWAIAERFFTPAEQRALRRFPPTQQSVAFFDFWTRKEAVLKASGDGLSHALDGFDVSLAPAEPAQLLPGHGNWWVRSFAPAPGYAAAVAARGTNWRLNGDPMPL